MIKLSQFTLSFLAVVLYGHLATVNAQVQNEEETTSFKVKLFRSDTNKPIASANVLLTKDHQSYETFPDPEGSFIFDKVIPGEYTLAINITYDNEKDVPCQMLHGKLKDEKDSSSFVIPRENKRIYIVFIKNVVLKPKQNITKTYDLVCVSAPD